MAGRLQNFRAVITGGSDGLGLSIASAFVQEGADVWLVARNASRLASARDALSSHGTDVRYSVADLTNPTAPEQIAAEVGAVWKGLDVLVNNAGMARFTPFAETTETDLLAQMQLNLLAPYRLTQRLLPLLETSQGNVINISSTSAHRLIPGRPASVYAMTKGGLNSLTKALALELGPRGVRVNALAPGTIKTPLTNKMLAAMSDERKAEYDQFVQQSFALGRLGEPDEVARMAVQLASTESAWITGSVFIVDGGLSTN